MTKLFFLCLSSFCGLLFIMSGINLEDIKTVERVIIVSLAAILYIRYALKPEPANAWVLFPAGMIVVFAPLVYYFDVTGWDNISWLWPAFLFGPSLGFIQWYFFGGRNRMLIGPMILFLAPGFTLTWFNYSQSLPMNAAVWWPLFPLLIALALHFVTLEKHRMVQDTIRFCAGTLLSCSLIFFINTAIDIPYSILWPLFLISPVIGVAESVWLNSRKKLFAASHF